MPEWGGRRPGSPPGLARGLRAPCRPPELLRGRQHHPHLSFLRQRFPPVDRTEQPWSFREKVKCSLWKQRTPLPPAHPHPTHPPLRQTCSPHSKTTALGARSLPVGRPTARRPRALQALLRAPVPALGDPWAGRAPKDFGIKLLNLGSEFLRRGVLGVWLSPPHTETALGRDPWASPGAGRPALLPRARGSILPRPHGVVHSLPDPT